MILFYEKYIVEVPLASIMLSSWPLMRVGSTLYCQASDVIVLLHFTLYRRNLFVVTRPSKFLRLPLA
jgi:hypothetical protein